MKTLMLAMAAMVACVAAAYTQAPVAMKTTWGEKVNPQNAWRNYPRPQLERKNWTNLNGLWKYAIVKQNELVKNAPSWPTAWDGDILVPFVIESSLSGVGRKLEPSETLWYKNSFNASPKAGERILLHFEQADFRTQVFVNGVEVGVPHEGGQIPFTYDVTDYAKAGANELLVAIWDPTTDFVGSTGKQVFSPGGCMYTRSSGIGGTVWMETVPDTHIVDYKVVTDIDAGTVRLDFNVACPKFAKPEVEVSVAGQTVKSQDGVAVIKMPAGFKLWSPETPNLYDFTAKCAGDEIKGYFGMRKIETKKDPNGVLRFYFNNQARFIIATLDQGWWPDGLLTPPSEEAMAFDINSLKQMGYDAMRKHIKVEPRRYYYLCDKLGMIVLQDMPSGAGDRVKRYGFYREELKQMMDLLQAVPSIVMWIPYNEAWGQPGRLLTHNTLMWTQRYDPTRLVNGPSGANDWEGGELWFKNGGGTKHLALGVEEAAHSVDKHDYAHRPHMFPVNERRASFLGEFGGIGCRIADHLWTKNAWGYNNTGKLSRKETENRFITLMDHVAQLAERGLSGSVYTQTTDVEGEINGLLTYDRKIMKFDTQAIAAVHERVRKAAELGLRPRESRTLIARLDPNPTTWAYTTTEPAAGWEQCGFNDGAWKRARGGFGNEVIKNDQPRAKVYTDWSTPSIWLRRHFTYTKPNGQLLRAVVEMFHDEDAEVYLNGKLIVKAENYSSDWVPFTVLPDAFNAAVKEGDNVIAVKVVQKVGGQYFDLGITLDFLK